jgi:hypothetical protein
VRELGGGARLAPEPLDVVVVLRVVLVEDLQRHVALEQRVVRAVDARHAAGADDVLQLVPVRDQLAHRHHGTVPTGLETEPGGVAPARFGAASVPVRYFAGRTSTCIILP